MNKSEVIPKNKKTEKKNINQLFEDISIKEIGILVIGVVIILGAILFVPKWYSDLTTEPVKTLDELHADNYNNPETEISFLYNGFSFVKLADTRTNVDFWYTQYEYKNILYNIPFRYNPREVEHITKYSIESTQSRNYTKVYITVDPTDVVGAQKFTALAVGEFTEILGKVKSYPMFGACTVNETNACMDRPIITCDDRGDFLTFYFKESNETRIIINDNCITIEGVNETLLQATDKTIYGFLGMME